MTITQNEQLIINLGKGTRIFEKDHVKKALEAYEPKPTCANYERDNKEETKWFDIAVLKASQEHYMQSKKAYDYYVQNNPLLSEMEQHIFDAMEKGICKDKIVESVRQKLLDRSSVGIKKYGEQLGNYSKYNFISEMQQEALDFANYCEVELQKEETINQLLKKYPNNFDLGTAIRKLYS